MSDTHAPDPVPSSTGIGLVGNGPTVEDLRGYSHDTLEEMGSRGPVTAETVKDDIQAAADAQIAAIQGNADAAIALVDAHQGTISADILAQSVALLTDPSANLHMKHTVQEEELAQEMIEEDGRGESPLTDHTPAHGDDDSGSAGDDTNLARGSEAGEILSDRSFTTTPAVPGGDPSVPESFDPNALAFGKPLGPGNQTGVLVNDGDAPVTGGSDTPVSSGDATEPAPAESTDDGADHVDAPVFVDEPGDKPNADA